MATRTTYRRTAARLLGRYRLVTGAAAGGSTTNARITELITSLSVADQLSDFAFLIPAAVLAGDRDNRFVTSGPSTAGDLTLDRALSASTIANSAVIELHGSGISTLEDWDYLTNEALKSIFLPVTTVMTPLEDTRSQDLTAANNPWFEFAQTLVFQGAAATGRRHALTMRGVS